MFARKSDFDLPACSAAARGEPPVGIQDRHAVEIDHNQAAGPAGEDAKSLERHMPSQDNLPLGDVDLRIVVDQSIEANQFLTRNTEIVGALRDIREAVIGVGFPVPIRGGAEEAAETLFADPQAGQGILELLRSGTHLPLDQGAPAADCRVIADDI
jgi:hypothetical protein